MSGISFHLWRMFGDKFIYKIDTMELSYIYIENGKTLYTKTEEVKIKKPMLLFDYVYHWGNGVYNFLLKQLDEKKLLENCEKRLKDCVGKIENDKDSSNYLGKNITKVRFELSAKYKILESTYENFINTKEFNKTMENKNE